MALDKQFARIEAKLDALLTKSGLKPADFATAPTRASAPAKLSAADQQAIDNAPKTPTGASSPVGTGPRVDATTHAPITPATTGKGE